MYASYYVFFLKAVNYTLGPISVHLFSEFSNIYICICNLGEGMTSAMVDTHNSIKSDVIWAEIIFFFFMYL